MPRERRRVDPEKFGVVARPAVGAQHDGVGYLDGWKCGNAQRAAQLQEFAHSRQSESVRYRTGGREIAVGPHAGAVAAGAQGGADQFATEAATPVRGIDHHFGHRRMPVVRRDEIGVPDDSVVDDSVVGDSVVGDQDEVPRVAVAGERMHHLLRDRCGPVHGLGAPDEVAPRLCSFGGRTAGGLGDDAHSANSASDPSGSTVIPPPLLRDDGRTALYPTLRTVPISDSYSGPSFARNRRTCTSTVRVPPKKS